MADETNLVKCENCGQEVPKEDAFHEGDQLICEECYLDKHQKIKACDPWGVHSKKVLRERAGQEGTEGLTDLQKRIYELIVSRNGATQTEIVRELEISPNELQNQIAILRHCELLKGQNRDGVVYVVPFDA
ncbi:MAG: hypothetical protein WCY97_05765 [Methanothrix sp.]|jgi:hypothetical protein|uniref:Uncharacterized protein n=1 Tax=Methanothrix harundinacea TaxID=301375 RepID=A0A117LFA7_9EURY|nr:MAG: Uncharacterized protein XD72_1617 [Methanothrix harundinacea]MDD2637445.1 hypothetical protein [Methanothrix sp.]MDI9399831.1 hypothetical protein [Euryarchaeota archaeon]KUK97753.1 MAG: Uncharacterized protein XE07_0167 [Methanothrix harundinacea]MCP1392479.1 hypothetical protein [Methanothrix harundinacea]